MNRHIELSQLNIAILLPCHNEQGAIGDTIQQFRQALPESHIYVYDNNSTDNTVAEALEAGAMVKSESRQGKGEVIRRMFADIDADIYVMADGDNTYDAAAAPALITLLLAKDLDMVTGARSTAQHAYPAGHILGNKIFSNLINHFFKAQLRDVFSGYRVMSRRFVKTVPVFSDGFQIETELTVHALHHKFPLQEIDTLYHPRPSGTASKLRTFSDGWKILTFIVFLIRDVQPLFFFTISALVLAAISLLLGIPVIAEFSQTGLVPRFPTAILASSVAVLSAILLLTGIILDNVRRGRRENIVLYYLQHKTAASVFLPPSDKNSLT
jgi:glycosyltransferase involved in cell wall biosynthesis